jgi:hypothetical protein
MARLNKPCLAAQERLIDLSGRLLAIIDAEMRNRPSSEAA